MAAQPLPTPPSGVDPEAVVRAGVTWWGHATTVVELGGQALLTDPLLRPGVGPLRWARSRPPHGLARRASAVLISHLHHDHLDLLSLASVPAGVPVLVPAGGARYVTRHVRAELVEVAEGDVVQLGEVTVRAVHAEHDGRRWPLGPAVAALGYLLTGPTGCDTTGCDTTGNDTTVDQRERRSVYFAGDTDVYPQMADLARHRLSMALLPVGGWGVTLGKGHLNAHRAAQALQLLLPAAALPIHWGGLRVPGVWRSRPHLFHTPGVEFAEQAAELAPQVRVIVAGFGKRVELR